MIRIAWLGWAGALATLLPSPAAGQLPQHEMHGRMERYFDGELRESWAFLSTGSAAVGGGIALAVRGGRLGRGASIPAIGLGVIQLGAGIVLQARTRAQVRGLHDDIAGDPLGYQEAELARMRQVNREFDLLKATEISLAVAGAGTALAGFLAARDFVLGLGAGLAVQSLLMLMLDLFAEARADRYTLDLVAFAVAIETDPASAAVLVALPLS